MTWQLLVSLSILLYSVNALLHRVLMRDKHSDAHAQAVVFNGLTGLCALIILLFRDSAHINYPTFNQLPLMFLVVLCVTIATICAFKGLKLIEASEHTILLTSSKIWLIIGAIFLLQENFTIWKLIGAMTILIGVLITEWKKQKFVFNAGAIYVLIAAFLYAAGEIFAFYILRNFDAIVFMVYTSFLCLITLLLIKPSVIKRISFYFKPKFALYIIAVSISDTLATLFVFLAYQTGRNALQIGPLMASQTIVTVLLALIILKETDHLPQKILGAFTVVIGSILLIR